KKKKLWSRLENHSTSQNLYSSSSQQSSKLVIIVIAMIRQFSETPTARQFSSIDLKGEEDDDDDKRW
ncbi:unnamed protein product, partial [Arabidopsis halleri]